MRTRTVGTLSAVALALLAGCSTNELAMIGEEPRQEITYAALAEYPQGVEASDELKLWAVNYENKDMLEVFNTSDQSIPASTLWVNGAFLSRIDPIPPRGSVKVKYSEVLEAGRGVNDLKDLGGPIAKLELQTDQGLLKVQGPANK